MSQKMDTKISSKNRGFLNWINVLRGGFNKRNLWGSVRYVLKFGVFFNIL
jgi:hypothetical protein